MTGGTTRGATPVPPAASVGVGPVVATIVARGGHGSVVAISRDMEHPVATNIPRLSPSTIDVFIIVVFSFGRDDRPLSAGDVQIVGFIFGDAQTERQFSR